MNNNIISILNNPLISTIVGGIFSGIIILVISLFIIGRKKFYHIELSIIIY